MNRRDFTHAQAYAEAARQLSQGPGWLAQARAGAAQALQESGFPGRDEAWKYTRASSLLQEAFVPAAPVELPAERPAHFGEALGDVDGFLALNLAFLRESRTIRVPAGEKREVTLVHRSEGAHRLGAVRHLVEVEPGAELVLYERFETDGEGPSLTTAAIEVLVGQGARVRHVRVLDEGAEALHVGATAAVVEARGSYALTSVVLGGDVARIEARVRLAGEGAETELSGLSLLRGKQHADHHVLVDHAVPNTKSDQLFRAVLDDRSRSVYTGAVHVREGAIGTDSAQLHNALLLSDDAVVNARPWLEIYADDVRCAHGAAIGSLDEEALFYLRQRGLTQHAARALLTAGFASQVLDRVPEGPVREGLEKAAAAWMEAR